MKKLVSLLLALVMVLTAASFAAAEEEAFAETVTIRIPVYDRGVQGCPDVENNYWTKWVNENFGAKYNVNVEFVGITRSDVLTDYSLLAADQNLPTVLMEYDYDKVSLWANEGYLQTIDLDEFAEVAPLFYSKMVENNQLVYTQLNDKTYFVLAERPYFNTDYTFQTFVRMDWLEAVGYDYVPVKYDEWCDAMDKIMEAGIAEHPAGGHKVAGAGVDQNYKYRAFPFDEEEWAKYSFITTTSLGSAADYALLKRENHNYNVGYTDPEYYLTDAETEKANFIAGKCYSYSGYISGNMDWLNSFYANNPDAKLAISPVMTEIDEASDGIVTTPAYRANNPFGMTIGFSATATADEIKAAWMYMDWLLQPENLFTFQWGFEGENFNYNADGMAESVADYEGEFKQGYNNNKDYWCIVIEARAAGTIEQTVDATSPVGLPQSFNADILKFYYDRVEAAKDGWAISDPLVSVTIASENEYKQELINLYAEYRDKLTMCSEEEFDALYAELSQKYLDAGYQLIIDERLAAYENGNTTKMPK